MKVKIVVESDLEEEYAELHVKGITDEISRLSEIIQDKSQVITGKDEYERIVVIEKADIVALHAEKKWCRIIRIQQTTAAGRDYMRLRICLARII